MADSTEINTFVVDVKSERGVHYNTSVPLAKELQQEGDPRAETLTVDQVRALLGFPPRILN